MTDGMLMDRAKLEELRYMPAWNPNGGDGHVMLTPAERDALFAYIDRLERELAECEHDWEVENGPTPAAPDAAKP